MANRKKGRRQKKKKIWGAGSYRMRQKRQRDGIVA